MKCPACKSEMTWQNDFDLEDYDYEESGVASFYSCSNKKCESQFIHVQKEIQEGEE